MKVGSECVGCGQCAPYCPFEAMIIFGRAAINEKCTECATCIGYCPVSAISE